MTLLIAVNMIVQGIRNSTHRELNVIISDSDNSKVMECPRVNNVIISKRGILVLKL
jgi:F420-0:gamma-glutamyl ligase